MYLGCWESGRLRTDYDERIRAVRSCRDRLAGVLVIDHSLTARFSAFVTDSSECLVSGEHAGAVVLGLRGLEVVTHGAEVFHTSARRTDRVCCSLERVVRVFPVTGTVK